MSYMRNTWQHISEKVSVYNCPVRTNNLVESFHNTALKHFGRHTNIWIFVGNLKKLIITQQIDFGRAKNNLQVRRVHSKINKKRNEIVLQRQEDLNQNRLSLMEFLKSFYQFNEVQQYLIDATSSNVIHENNEMDKICADLLSESPIVNHDKELDENDDRNNLSNNRNSRRRSRRIIRTQFPSENIRSVETESEEDNPKACETTISENKDSPTKLTEYITECYQDDTDENIFIVPEDDYGFWYENMTNGSDDFLPYYPIEQLSSNVHTNDYTTEKNKRPEGTCVICLDLKANQIIIPCGHMCLCANCIHTFTDTNNKECPLCKGQIRDIVRVISS